MPKSNGFTLIELIVVLVVVGILAGIAAPSFTSMMAGNRLASDTNGILGALQLARSEAVTRRASITVTNMAAGAKVMQGATLIRQLSAPSSGIVINPSAATITYRPDGSLSAQATVLISGSAGAKLICIFLIGQAAIEADGALPCGS